MTAESFVRVDCDYGADGLWSERGAAIGPESLGLSPALCVALQAWQLHYDDILPAMSRNAFDAAGHEAIGRRIAALVQQERPDLRVVYGRDVPYPGEKPQQEDG
jgi:hypothetical protein